MITMGSPIHSRPQEGRYAMQPFANLQLDTQGAVEMAQGLHPSHLCSEISLASKSNELLAE